MPDCTQSYDECPGRGAVGVNCVLDVESVEGALDFAGSEQRESGRVQSGIAAAGTSAGVLTGATAVRALNCQAHPVP